LRVSRTAERPPASRTASTYRAVSVDALGRQQRPGGPADEGHLGGDPVPPLPLDHQDVELAGPRLAKCLARRGEAEDDPGLLLDDARPRAGIGGNRRLGGDVAAADVLGQRPGDERLE
jgi:hypothetical protein